MLARRTKPFFPVSKMQMLPSMSDNMKIGILMVALGFLFLFLGMLLFFDAGLLTIGNALLLAGKSRRLITVQQKLHLRYLSASFPSVVLYVKSI